MTVSRQGMAYEIVSGGDSERDAQGFALYEVRFWDSAQRQRDGLGSHVIDGQPCDLMNNFKMQIREQHQRIVTLPDSVQSPEGYVRHVSGLPVPKRLRGSELATFLTGQGLALGGYDPFHFPSYAGVEELLNGMWQHEQHAVPLLGQAAARIERYIDTAIRLGLEGDHRGTTLNLQIGASTDDAEESVISTVMELAGDNINFGKFGSTADHVGLRFTNVTGMGGATVTAATLTFEPSAVDNGAFVGDWFAHDTDAPGTFTSDNANISGRAQTTATVEGDGGDFGNWTTDTPVEFTDDGVNNIFDILQELADDYNPSAIALLHIYGSGEGERVFDAYDLSTEDAVTLDITFTPSPETGVTGIGYYPIERHRRRKP